MFLVTGVDVTADRISCMNLDVFRAQIQSDAAKLLEQRLEHKTYCKRNPRASYTKTKVQPTHLSRFTV